MIRTMPPLLFQSHLVTPGHPLSFHQFHLSISRKKVLSQRAWCRNRGFAIAKEHVLWTYVFNCSFLLIQVLHSFLKK